MSFGPNGMHEARVSLKGLVEGSVGTGSHGADRKRPWGSPNQSLIPTIPRPTKVINRAHDSSSSRWGVGDGVPSLFRHLQQRHPELQPLTLALNLDSLFCTQATVP